jgi:hypothetical protein
LATKIRMERTAIEYECSEDEQGQKNTRKISLRRRAREEKP